MAGKTLKAEHAVVASEQPLASAAGNDVLQRGGNAFDAAVATSFALAVTFHPAGGLGGDFLGMFYESKSGRVHCLNSSGWSPSGLTADLAMSAAGGGVPRFGPFTCMVPGYVGGVWEMHRRFGTQDFRGLLTASSRYASDGFPAGEGICRSTAGAFDGLTADALAVFAPRGVPPSPGEWIRQEKLGQVISEIADRGPDAFYSGWPAEKICDLLTSYAIPAKLSDFREFKPEWVTPIALDYRGTTVYEVPPNSMGATSLLILKLLSEGQLSQMGPLSKGRVAATMEAAVAAYDRRDKMLGDPRFGAIDLDEFMATPVKQSTLGSRINAGDTTAFAIADQAGNLVAVIQSLFNQFGSRVFVPECGIMLNNRGAGFSTGGPNKVEPRKRPLNTLSSMVLERDGRPFLAIGTSGGDYRPLQHTLFVTNAVDYSMSVERNVGHPRFLWGGGDALLMEEGYEPPDQSRFRVQHLPAHGRTGVCQAVELSGGLRIGVCDIRGDGTPSGF